MRFVELMNIINKLLRLWGYKIHSIERLQELKGADDFLKRRRMLVETCKINFMLDVGANVGQFAQSMRALGFKGPIVSFEPLSSAYAELQVAAADDPLWRCHNYALAAAEGTATINISANSVSSSLLKIRDIHLRGAPSARYVGTEAITLKTLDAVFPRIVPAGASVLLKIDAQGYERQILDGARNSLEHIELIHLEVLLCSLYEGDSTICDLINYLEDFDLVPVSIEPGFSDKRTGQQYQIDILFSRNHSLPLA